MFYGQPAEALALDPTGQKLHERVQQSGIAMDLVRSTGTRKPHRHACYEIVFVHAGTTLWSVQGRSHVVVSDEILVFNAESVHSSRPVQGQYLRTGIHFLPDLVPADLLSYLPRPEDPPWYIAVPEGVSPRLFGQFQRLRLLTRSGRADAKSYALLAAILQELIRLSQEGPREDETTRLVREIVSYMMNNLHRDESLKDLARRFYISEGHLCHLFRTRFGCSPKRLWQFMKIERICSSLGLIHHNVDSLAQQFGFQTRRGFERAFRRVTGMPVSAYRALVGTGS